MPLGKLKSEGLQTTAPSALTVWKTFHVLIQCLFIEHHPCVASHSDKIDLKRNSTRLVQKAAEIITK